MLATLRTAKILLCHVNTSLATRKDLKATTYMHTHVGESTSFRNNLKEHSSSSVSGV